MTGLPVVGLIITAGVRRRDGASDDRAAGQAVPITRDGGVLTLSDKALPIGPALLMVLMAVNFGFAFRPALRGR